LLGILANVAANVSGRLNPTEYDKRWPTSQFRNSCVAPAPSARIRILRPGRVPGLCPGSCASAALTTVMCSAAVLLPALPLRSRQVSGSPVPSAP
jgi:hypothetical protein